jgi:hypothetical protein
MLDTSLEYIPARARVPFVAEIVALPDPTDVLEVITLPPEFVIFAVSLPIMALKLLFPVDVCVILLLLSAAMNEASKTPVPVALTLAFVQEIIPDKSPPTISLFSDATIILLVVVVSTVLGFGRVAPCMMF